MIYNNIIQEYKQEMENVAEKACELKKTFFKVFGPGAAPETVFAPGRVNLIGEHTDNNGGFVLPCALSYGTLALGRKRSDRKIRMYSHNVTHLGILESSLDDLKAYESDHFTGYVKGVIWAAEEAGFVCDTGMDILIWGDVPNGSGLSSSAALEVSVGLLIKTLFSFEEMTQPQIALLSQKAENDFMGMQCGIMDQFISAMGKEGHALLLNTGTLTYEHIPLVLEGAEIVIINSCVKHSLVGSAYNDRRNECETALDRIRKAMQDGTLAFPASGKLPEGLCELTPDEFEDAAAVLKDEILYARAKHAVYENDRAIRAAEALSQGNKELFGTLMKESHASLRDLYEVSCAEMDVLTDIANSKEYVLGARMTGGGFGGCSVNLIKEGYEEQFRKEVGEEYTAKTGKKPLFYACVPGDGARVIKQ